MKNAKIPQRKKASLSALAANIQNSDLILSSAGVMSISQGSIAKEGHGYASVDTSYDLAKEGAAGYAAADVSYDLAKEAVGYAMVDPAFDIAKEASGGSFA